MKSVNVSQIIKVVDKVTIDNDKIEIFRAENSSDFKSVRQYQQLVLGGIDQFETVKVLRRSFTTVSYFDGWNLPVQTKYLIVLPE